MPYPKRIQKEIKRLTRAAYEKEMRHYLDLLSRQFSDWKNKKLGTRDLVLRIHKFHNGQARDIYNSFQGLSPASFLIRAVARGYLMENELPEEIREEICRHAEMLKGQLDGKNS